MKNIYFISDAHLGCLAMPHPRQQERRLVRFLDDIKAHAQAVYLLGDMFDFWFEYKTVVPRGYTRFLGKISELTDSGIEVHFFVGNHDLWCKDYLEKECGMIIHHGPETIELGDSVFYLSHGDGLGERSWSFQLLRTLFRNRLCQRLYAMLHPRWAMTFGLAWARNSRLKHMAEGGEPDYLGEDKEPLVCYAKDYLKSHPTINYFVFGHRHIELDLMLSRTTRVLILGDWIKHFSYAVYDGEHLYMENYIEGDSFLS